MRKSEAIVYGKTGQLGHVALDQQATDDRQDKLLVTFDSGGQAWVDKDLFVVRDDGDYVLPYTKDQLLAQNIDGDGTVVEHIVIPVIEEELNIAKHPRKTTVRVTKEVIEEEETIDDTGFHERIDIERVPVDRIIQEPMRVRYEGETMVIPVMEEVVVVEKRLVLKEEIRVTKSQVPAAKAKPVTLRKERVKIERFSGVPDEDNS